jgi:hypothetical protein
MSVPCSATTSYPWYDIAPVAHTHTTQSLRSNVRWHFRRLELLVVSVSEVDESSLVAKPARVGGVFQVDVTILTPVSGPGVADDPVGGVGIGVVTSEL